jgi:signal transduction histidine kinase
MLPVDATAPPCEVAKAWREEFAEEVATRNLRWIWWLMVTSTVLLLLYVALNLALPAMRSQRLLIAQLIDLGVTVPLLVLLARLRRQPPGTRWRRWFPVVYVVIVFAVFDYYHLSALATAGETGSYVLGVVAVGVIVMLPPRLFMPMLLGNHALYLALVAVAETKPGVRLLAAMDGTAGVLVAGLASGLLYSARWNDFLRERLLARTNAELARANAEMSDLMAIAAHDLRSPLEGVKRMLGVVRTRTEWSRAQIERAVDTCLESCGGMVTFVGRLLDAHAVEAAAEKKLTLVARDLRAECASAVERARPAAERKGQRVVMLAPETPATVRAEATALAQVLDNLLTNAVKFSPTGATVECALVAAGAAWRVEVRDEGPGVTAEERATLFRKFHRGSARPTGGESSSGLGLFIVKTLTEAMGGRVSCESREPRGAVFRIELPQG